MTDVFRGVGDLLPHPIDCRRELRSVTLGLSSQFLNGSVIASHSWITFLTCWIVPRRDEDAQLAPHEVNGALVPFH
jgi:hypothetical protein